MTSLTTLLMGAALFQRRSRSGWLDELDGIRHDALASPGGEVAVAMAAEPGADAEWPEPEEKTADDQYGIASLYATDEPADAPAPAAPRGRSWASLPDLTRKHPAPPAPAEAAPTEPAPTLADLPAPPAPPVAAPVLAELPPPPAPPAPPAVPPVPPAPPAIVEPAAALPTAPVSWSDPATEAKPTEDEARLAAETERVANWAQPAPHPIRPSELWHAAVPPTLVEEVSTPAVEERLDSADLVGAEQERRRFPTFRPVAVDPATSAASASASASASVEDALGAASVPAPLVDHGRAPMVPLAPAASASGLINGPVARRVRRDRPTDRIRTPLPPSRLPDQSPLPTAPLPPAALPVARPAAPAPVAEPTTPVAPAAPAAQPVAPVAESIAPAVAEPVVAPEPAAPVDLAPVPLAVDADGTVAAADTVVRLGGARRASALTGTAGPELSLAEGWVWVAPAGPAPTAVQVDLPDGRLVLEAGSTALAAVEADGSTFVLIASGQASLSRGTDEAPLRPGTMVLLSADGQPQIDTAGPDEIESDPIVAHNRALDAAR